MPPSPLFYFDSATLAAQAREVLGRLPRVTGEPIRIQRRRGLRDPHGAVHAGSYLRERRIALDCSPGEFNRVFVHELFHFVWLRLGNRRRHSYEALLRLETEAGARGELGWSAEWRKQDLSATDVRSRTRRWREYCCESFCDSAAWLYSGVRRHEEFTLAGRHRDRRRRWFADLTEGRQISI